MDRDVIEHVLHTSDPTLRAVIAEDAAALVGLTIAAAALALHQITGSAVPDARVPIVAPRKSAGPDRVAGEVGDSAARRAGASGGGNSCP